ncbi:hypothetical protein KP509_1Z211500 [Ceratopteris richardii]|nr:hypothetical protein KP509_1Z211500 [Ceratopteris richardii]
MGNLLTLRFFCFSFCPKSRTSLEQDSVEEKWHLPCEVNLSSPNRKGHNQNLKATSKPISQDSRAARLQDKLFNLVEKVNTLQWNHPVQTSSSISIPVKSGRNIADLQKKIESLKLQVLKERNQRQAVAQQLNTLRHQNEKDLQHKQKIWENKFRELQKEKYNLSIRLQIENERATESLREAQRQAKERERLLLEQNNALVTQLASLQASYSPKRSNEMAYASLTESLSLKAEILNAQARESALITELEKIKDDKKILENKVSDLEGKVNMRTKQPNETRDVPCQCLHSNDETACFHPENPDPEDKTGSTTSQQMQDLEIYKKKVESLEKSLRDKEAIIKHLEQNHSGIDREEDDAALSCINKVEAVRHGSLMDEEQPKCTEHSSKEVYLSAKEGALDTSKSSQVERGIGEKSIQFPTKDSGDVSHTLDATKPSSRENYVDLVPHLYQDASNIPLAKSAESQHIFNGR